MKAGDLDFLKQMILGLEETISKFENSYNNKNYEEFNKSKRLILQIHDKISEVLNG